MHCLDKYKKNEKFWAESMTSLFTNFYLIIPSKKMKRERKMNTISRLIIFVFIIMVIFGLNLKNNILFLLFSLIIIILLYYKEKKPIMIENYNDFISPTIEESKKKIKQPWEDDYRDPKEDEYYCKDKIFKPRINYDCRQPDDTYPMVYPIDNSSNTRLNPNTAVYNKSFERKTNNQGLVGKVNPKTLIPPIIAPPLADIDHWRKNSSVTQSIINTKKPKYDPISGYQTMSNDNCNMLKRIPRTCDRVNRNISQTMMPANNSLGLPSVTEIPQPPPTTPQLQAQFEIKENYNFPYEIKSPSNFLNEPNSLYNRPIKKNPYFKNRYATNLFTDTVSPGLYTEFDINEPINAWSAISEPIYQEKEENEIIEPYETINASNTFDPRFYGYGTSYRGYFDEFVGQPKYYYDDIDSVKMPNYISRNNIDFMPFGDTYGPMNNEGNYNTNRIHELANQHFHDSQIQFRSEMQERLMRKKNRESWQQKMYPIRKHSQRA